MKKLSIAATCVAALFYPQAQAAAPVAEAGASSATAVSATTSNMTAEQRIERLERMLQARNQVQIDMQNQLDDALDTISVLRGQIEQNNYQIEQMVERQRELYQELDRRFAQVQQGSATAAAATAATATATTATASEDQAYDEAIALIMQKKDYDAAIPALESFLKDFPESNYAANAHYWLGQLHYTRGNREQASAQFQMVLDKYPKSNKKLESLLKLGIIANNQGDKATAKSYFEQVIAAGANSSEAKLAQQQLSKL